MISYLWRALRLSQIVLKVGAAALATGFFADFAVGGGLVGLAFCDLFKVNFSVNVPWRERCVAHEFNDLPLYAGFIGTMKGI